MPKTPIKSVASKKKIAPKAGAFKTKAVATPTEMPTKAKSARALQQKPTVDASERNRMIELAAYHLAERDGFKPGREHEYWIQGEAQVNQLLGEDSSLQ